MNKLNKAVILAGGKGTRLGLVDRPKPMVFIDGSKSLLEIQIEWLISEKINEVYLLVNHLPHVIQNEIGNGSKWNINIHYIIEDEPLGTAGALAQLKGVIQGDFLVVYGDLLCRMDLTALYHFHYEKKSELTLVTHPNDHPFDSDLVEVDNNTNKVIGFLTKPHPTELVYNNIVNAAVYVFSEKALNQLESGVFKDLARDVFPTWVKNLNIFSYKTFEYLKDMGTPERLEKVKKDYKTGVLQKKSLVATKSCVFWDRDGTICEFVDNLSLPDQIVLRKNVAQVLREFNQRGILNVIITNQPGIAKGMMTFSGLDLIHKKLETLLGENQAWIDAIYFCPHHPEKGFEGEIVELKINCQCRKPKTGMIESAFKDLNIDLENCYFVGDSFRDLECANNLDIPFYGFLGGESSKEKLLQSAIKTQKDDTFFSDDIMQIKEQIIKRISDKVNIHREMK